MTANRTAYLRAIVIGCVAFSCVRHAGAYPRSFNDISKQSPSKQYKVEAKSPDNRPDSKRPFWQSNFVCTCTDTRSDKVLWTRKQAAKERAPVALFVSDAGWTVIRTSSDEVISVDPQGKDRGAVDLLGDAFTRTEFKEHVHFTSAGFHWDNYSIWSYSRDKMERPPPSRRG